MQKGKHAFAAAFLFPGFILFTGFIIFAIIMNFFYSFTDWNAMSTPNFVGLNNYINIFKDPDYLQGVKNNLLVVFFAFLIQNPLAYILAYLVTRVKRGQKVYQTVFFLPVVISAVATATMFAIMFNSDNGILAQFLALFGLEYAWLSDAKVVMFAVIFPQLWQYLGIHFVMFIGGILSISEEVLESAKIDGAGSGRLLWNIVIPLSWPSISMSLIYTFIGCLKSFDYSFIMTKGGPGTASSYIATILYKQGFINYNYGYATAIAVTIFLYSLIFTLSFKRATKKWDLD